MFNIRISGGGTHAGWRTVKQRPKGEWKCPECKAVNRAYWVNCPSCHAGRP